MSAVTCPACDEVREVEPLMFRGREFVPQGRCGPCEDREDARTAKIRQEGVWTDRRNRSQMPSELQDVSLPSGRLGEIGGAWARGEFDLLVLTGRIGVGKTYLAAAAAWAAFTYRSVRWVGVARAMGQLRASFGDDDREKALKALTGADSVVLDDIDKVPATEFGLSTLFAAIDGRVAEGVPMLVTMNTSLDQLARQIDRSKGMELGQAIASRLSVGRVLELDGVDRRRPA